MTCTHPPCNQYAPVERTPVEYLVHLLEKHIMPQPKPKRTPRKLNECY